MTLDTLENPGEFFYFCSYWSIRTTILENIFDSWKDTRMGFFTCSKESETLL